MCCACFYSLSLPLWGSSRSTRKAVHHVSILPVFALVCVGRLLRACLRGSRSSLQVVQSCLAFILVAPGLLLLLPWSPRWCLLCWLPASPFLLVVPQAQISRLSSISFLPFAPCFDPCHFRSCACLQPFRNQVRAVGQARQFARCSSSPAWAALCHGLPVAVCRFPWSPVSCPAPLPVLQAHQQPCSFPLGSARSRSQALRSSAAFRYLRSVSPRQAARAVVPALGSLPAFRVSPAGSGHPRSCLCFRSFWRSSAIQNHLLKERFLSWKKSLNITASN